MIKFYLFIFFIGFTFFCHAQQTGKNSEVDNMSQATQLKLMRYYPNPAVSVVNFEFLKPAPKGLTLQIYNFVGKKVFETTIISQKTTIQLNEIFLRGVYIYQVRDKSGRIVESGKFQVNK